MTMTMTDQARHQPFREVDIAFMRDDDLPAGSVAMWESLDRREVTIRVPADEVSQHVAAGVNRLLEQARRGW